MFRRWHHGHSIGVGALGGLAVYGYAPWLLLLAGAVAGAGATLLVIFGRRAWRALRSAASGLLERAADRRWIEHELGADEEPLPTGTRRRWRVVPHAFERGARVVYRAGELPDDY